MKGTTRRRKRRSKRWIWKMSNEIGENRVLFFVFGGRERGDYRVPFGMCCLSVWIWNWETITRVKTKWGLGSWTTRISRVRLWILDFFFFFLYNEFSFFYTSINFRKNIFFGLIFTTSWIWFGGQFWHQMVPALSRS
jgi:hypothetical protein